MTGSPSRTNGGDAASRARRGSRHVLYQIVALVAAAAILMGFVASRRMRHSYARSAQLDTWWERQLSDFAMLETLARDVSSATRGVLVSGDVAAEVANMRAALAVFHRRLEEKRSELASTAVPGKAAALGSDLEAVAAAVSGMSAEAAWILAEFEADRPEAALPRMTALDQRYLEVNEALDRLREHARGLQRRHLASQASLASSTNRLEYASTALVFLLVAALAVYSRRLAAGAERAGHELEERVEARTRDLDQAHDALRRSEQRYRTLFEGTPLPMWVFDPESLRFLAVNGAAIAHYGYTREEFQAISILDIRPSEEVGRLLDFLRDGPVQGDRRGEWKHRKKDGTLIDVEVCSQPVLLDEGPARLVLVMDITEEKRLEAQLRQSQKMEAVGRLAGGVAHDFNNLLGVMVGYGELIVRDPSADARTRGRGEKILQAADRAARLTGQLLAFGRKQVLQPRVLDLNAVVTDIGDMLQRLIGEDVRLVTTMAPGLGRVKADPGQIEQVILNLAVNARDAMPNGGALTVRTDNVLPQDAPAVVRAGGRPGPYVMLEVRDSGVGMDPETQAHIFEPFFTTKQPGKGTGLGLATVQGVIAQSGGHIVVESAPGWGTTFRIYLPAVEEASAPAAAPRAPGPTGGTETVLVVEDESALREIICETLKGGGYTVVECDAVEALDTCAARDGRIDLLLTDVVMPDIGGVELAGKLTAAWPEIRVVYMSGYTDELTRNHGLLDAGRYFLEKPFTGDRLLTRIREALDAPRPPRAAASAGGLLS